MAAARVLHYHDVAARREVVFLRERHPGALVIGRAHQQHREVARCVGTIHVGAERYAVARAHHLIFFDHHIVDRFTLLRVGHHLLRSVRLTRR